MRQSSGFSSNTQGRLPHLTDIRDSDVLDTELPRGQIEYNTVRLHHALKDAGDHTNND